MMVTSNVRLLRPLGEGGMGSVWIAEHQSLRTQVVVKFMARELAQSPEAIARFSREAAAASQVKSPHVVQMFDHGVLENGAPYIVMELLEGRDLEQQIRAGGALQPREVAAIVGQLARALSKAHERGIVHRDIKPSNVFLCDAGGGELFVKLLDFGIAKGPEVGIVGSTTRTGSFIGSPYYMSPEQVVGAKTIDFRTDLWSLGVVAFEALTAEKPFFAETVGALALKIHRDPIPAPSSVAPALGRAIDAWFARACAREAEARFASAKDMAEALAVAVTGEATSVGLRIDSLPTPKGTTGLEATQAASPSPAAETLRSGIDARSETGAGVGIPSLRVPGASRGKWMALGLIAAAAVGVGFVVPKIMGGAVDAGAGSAAAIAPAPETVRGTAATAESSVAGATATVTASETATAAATATAHATAAATAHASATAPVAATATARGTHPRATPSSTPSATATATATATASATKRTTGSEDEIK
jgi:serine/threonine-protein kinase